LKFARLQDRSPEHFFATIENCKPKRANDKIQIRIARLRSQFYISNHQFMKKLTILFLLLAIGAAIFGQRNKAVIPATKQDYLQKSKRQKTAAWILLSGGTALAISGAVISANETAQDIGNIFNAQYEEGGDAGVGLFIAGFSSMAGSIPLFIASGRNKKKAMSVAFNMQRVPQLQNRMLLNQSVPSIIVKLSL
jgi:hypothetical protein